MSNELIPYGLSEEADKAVWEVINKTGGTASNAILKMYEAWKHTQATDSFEEPTNE